MTSNKVSIIVPFYNAENTIERTLTSIFNQTYQNIELVLVDDGSTDNSVSTIQKLKDKKQFVLVKTKNSGPAKARIEGINHSSGQYIFFLDADDVLEKKAIEELVNSLEKSDADVAIANYETFNTEPLPHNSDIVSEYLPHEQLISELAKCQRIQNFLWGKLFKREVINTSDFDQKKRLGEDISTLIKIFHRCRSGVYLSGKPLVYYFVNQNSLSKRLDYGKLNDYCNALIEKTQFLKTHYPVYWKLTFHANIDYLFLIVVNYDLNRIYDAKILINFVVNSPNSLKDKIKVFLLKHPRIAKKFIKQRKQTSETNLTRVAVINTYNRMSTGNIAKDIGDGLSNKYYSKLFYGRCKDPYDNESVYVGGSRFYNLLNNVLVKLSGKIGGFHKRATKRLIRNLEKFNPSIIHLHNIHGNYLNYKLLFKYLENKKVIITAHDCFWLTGRCAHFLDYKINCDGWKTGCKKCRYKYLYMPTLFFDKAKDIFALKQKFIENSSCLKFVVLSKWQEELFKPYHPILIPNGFDFQTELLKREDSCSDDKLHIIGIAQNWISAKGILEFNQLAEDLDGNKFEITLIGAKTACANPNKKIRFLGKLDNTSVLNELRRADLFVNPTYVDTFPTVLIESLSCGVPVLTYDVGGCRDIVGECGFYVPAGDYRMLRQTIEKFDKSSFDKHLISEHAKLFAKKTMIERYRNLYDEVLHE